jgi:hypothetical protein
MGEVNSQGEQPPAVDEDPDRPQSHALQRLRRTLGDELLVRVGRDYVLTARAGALVPPVDLILETAINQVLTPTCGQLISSVIGHAVGFAAASASRTASSASCP